MAEKAGIPAGVVNVVTSSRDSASAAGKLLCEHPLIAKISFTGSTAVGKVAFVIVILVVCEFLNKIYNECSHPFTALNF